MAGSVRIEGIRANRMRIPPERRHIPHIRHRVITRIARVAATGSRVIAGRIDLASAVHSRSHEILPIRARPHRSVTRRRFHPLDPTSDGPGMSGIL